MKIKEKVNSIFQSLKNIYKRFPITMIAIIIETLVLSILLDRKWVSDEFIEYIIEFGLVFVPQTLLIEAFYERTSKKSILLYGISSIISLAFVITVNQRLSEIIGSWILRITISYIIILITTAIWMLLKKSGKGLEEYSIRTFSNLVKTTFTYFVLSIGIAGVATLFIYLILGGKFGYSLIWRLEILLFGLYYIPNLINSFTNVNEEAGKFINNFVKYVLGILLVVAFAIIYMYMIKIFAIWEIPSNQIFRILTLLFIFGLPIWTMIQHKKEEQDTFEKVCDKLPIAFIPFIVLQIYSIGVRIINNGFTPLRYIGVMFILFELTYILLYILKKEKISYIVFAFDILLIITLIVPGINMLSTSNLSQYNRLKIYKEKEYLSDEEKAKVHDAYVYLEYSINGENYINKLLDKTEITEIENFEQENWYYDNTYRYLYGSKSIKNIDIKDYTMLTVIEPKNEKNLKVDEILKTYIKECEKNRGSFNKYFENNNEWVIDENKKIILEYVSIKYNEITKEIEDYDIDGYILEK